MTEQENYSDFPCALALVSCTLRPGAAGHLSLWTVQRTVTTDSEGGRRTSLPHLIRCAVLESSRIVADLERTERFTQTGTEQGQTFLPSLATSSLVCCHFLLYSPKERLNPHQRHHSLCNALFPLALCQITWDCVCRAPIFFKGLPYALGKMT